MVEIGEEWWSLDKKDTDLRDEKRNITGTIHVEERKKKKEE